jgi:carbon monoxide dehydrogenase subunit G
LITIAGSYLFGISRKNVWPRLSEPNFLIDVIPGCVSLEYDGVGEYQGTIRIGVPGISGIYHTSVHTVETDPPRFCKYEGEVRGNSGTIIGNAEIYLKEDEDRCLLDYQAEGIITGALSKINSRYIEGFAQSLISHGISKLERRIISQK